MRASFGRKHKSHGKNYGKKDTSKFKKGLIAGGMLLAAGAGIYASAGDKETHQEIEYPMIAAEEGGGLGHQAAQVEKQKAVGLKVGEQSAPPPAIDLAAAEAALAPQKPAKKAKIAAGLNLAADVVTGDAGGKLSIAKQGISIATGHGEAAATKSLQEQIKQAEKNAKKKKTKISKESVGVGLAPMIGPALPPDFDVEEKKSKKDKVKSFFAKSKK
tara:strand:- start:452 stop:1099 length:648 start_codon:yes stop_codon:yes gene_type:complete